MNSLESAQEAIRELNNCTLSGRQLKVDLATGSTPEDRSIGNTVLEQRKRKRRAEGDEVCFDLLNGHCKRGSSCKFLHCLQEASAGSHNSTHGKVLITSRNEILSLLPRCIHDIVPSTRCTQEISVMRLRGSREDSHNRSRSSDQASRKDRTPRRFDKAKERISIAGELL